MRERWPRFRPEISLDLEAVQYLVRLVLPGASVSHFASVGGGLANTNLRVVIDVPPGVVLLRLYQRDPAQAAKEARLDGLLQAADVPTARFLGLIEADARTGLTVAVMDWAPGLRLDQLVPGAADAALGRSTGATLAKLHRLAVGPAGFLGPDRRPDVAIALGREAMLAYLRLCLIDGPGEARLGSELTARLFAYVEREGGRLADWPAAPGLVHGDCNASNFVMDDGRVVALLDWEFAFSGSPAFDFGNLMRPPIGSSAVFAAALAAGYREGGGALPPDWRFLARLTDLYAWADFLGRPVIAAPLVDDAVAMVADTVSKNVLF